MAHDEDIAALEALTPWQRPAFRAGLQALSASTAAASRQLAADARLLSTLAAQVPRCAGDERGASPWTSFRHEVAVARSMSGQAAAAELRLALRLTSVLPHTLTLLEQGRLTVPRARTLVQELEAYDDELAAQLDADLADVAATLAPWRIRQEVRRAVLTLDPDAAAVRTATATASRDVTMTPAPDGQACVVLSGPAVPVTRWYTTLDSRARALRAAGDPRTLAHLRFDLATHTYPCSTHPPAHPPADPTSPLVPDQPGAVPTRPGPDAAWNSTSDAARAAVGLRLSGVEAASVDCRMSRPVQAMIVVPVETALGLSNEPAWLDGYGWLDAPTSRTLLPDAELRQVCADRSTGQLLDLASRDRRPPPTPTGVRQALVDMITGETELSDTAWHTEPEHDPSPALRTFTTLRDRTCDGPTQSATPAQTCDQDHDHPHPAGPTAAWNLISRSRRTHALKHYGWTPIRTARSTIWTSPAGQVVDVPHHTRPTPGIDPDPTGRPAELPDPDQLADLDAEQLTALTDDQLPPVLPRNQQPPTQWQPLDGDDDIPF